MDNLDHAAYECREKYRLTGSTDLPKFHDFSFKEAEEWRKEAELIKEEAK